MSRFSDVLKGSDGRLKVLPILHSCDGYGFRGILESGTIDITYCNVFEKDYVYAYYGIPSYRKSSEDATKNKVWFPVCFILNYDFLPSFSKMYPFDTGGFMTNDKMRGKYFHDKMGVSDFELGRDIIDAARVIQVFYGGNEKYIRNEPCVGADFFGDLDFEARGYASLISSESRGFYDNRASTIEIIYDDSIHLNKESLVQVVIPESFLDEDIVLESLSDEYEIKSPLTYYTIRGNPVEYFGVIYNEYMRFVISNDLM